MILALMGDRGQGIGVLEYWTNGVLEYWSSELGVGGVQRENCRCRDQMNELNHYGLKISCLQ
jgi:hypothetical protein